MPIFPCRRKIQGGINQPRPGGMPLISLASQRIADSKIVLLTILISSSRRYQTPSLARVAPLEVGTEGLSRMLCLGMPRKNQRLIDMTSPLSISRPGGNPKVKASGWAGKITKGPSSTIAQTSMPSSRPKETLQQNTKVHFSL